MNPLEIAILALESVVQTVGVRAGVEQPPYRNWHVKLMGPRAPLPYP